MKNLIIALKVILISSISGSGLHVKILNLSSDEIYYLDNFNYSSVNSGFSRTDDFGISINLIGGNESNLHLKTKYVKNRICYSVSLDTASLFHKMKRFKRGTPGFKKYKERKKVMMDNSNIKILYPLDSIIFDMPLQDEVFQKASYSNFPCDTSDALFALDSIYFFSSLNFFYSKNPRASKKNLVWLPLVSDTLKVPVRD